MRLGSILFAAAMTMMALAMFCIAIKIGIASYNRYDFIGSLAIALGLGGAQIAVSVLVAMIWRDVICEYF